MYAMNQSPLLSIYWTCALPRDWRTRFLNKFGVERRHQWVIWRYLAISATSMFFMQGEKKLMIRVMVLIGYHKIGSYRLFNPINGNTFWWVETLRLMRTLSGIGSQIMQPTNHWWVMTLMKKVVIMTRF